MHLLTIPTPPNKSHIYWEHALKTVMGLAGTFALLIFVPMFLAAGTNRNRRADDHDIHVFAFFMERPWLQVAICVTLAIIYNVVIYRKNKKSNNVVGISVVNDRVEFQLNNIYFNRLEKIEIPVDDLSIKLLLKSSDLNGNTNTFEFINSQTGLVMGIIQTDHFIWDKQFKAIKVALNELQKLGIKIEKVNKRKGSAIEGLFR